MKFQNQFIFIITHLLALLPKNIQNLIHRHHQLDKTPIHFHVSQNSLWVGYKIKNESRIQNYLPDNLELIPIKVFQYDVHKHPFLFFNFFTVESDFFTGNRLEIVTVAKDRLTNKTRFVILDYLSDTISSDPIHLFKLPNAHKMNLFADQNKIMAYCDSSYHITALPHNLHYNLSKSFAIDCNENIYYGTKTRHLPNYLSFDHDRISVVKKVNIESLYNNLWMETRERNPLCAFFYPADIHFTIVPEKFGVNNDSFCSDEERRPEYPFLINWIV